ncbi:methyltransferase domain-containing protein [Sphingobium sufflavum]|uniref:class I SAM-dependent methyltransferase n=1 Tax=Sphingobium sufflavum TaxID=1129547 RepID=UPI001F4460A4|nr:class I SAM-dependent methyltransferase [Sphingobium sufflavum]MCE7798413.1 methyltransferase domain-containing protein [Sphingobium sufflavum]
MKYHIISATRSLGLLPVLDRMTFLRKTARTARGNRAFRARHPDFAVPPANLAFDAYNKVDWVDYHDLGIRHARLFAELIRQHRPVASNFRVLEWGCGPGRLIRHMPGLLADRSAHVVGTDYNPATIDWCREHLPGIDFALNGLAPPLPFPDNSFDATYNFSVFTHLSEDMHAAWTQELHRVLKPGGLMIATTHGEHCRYLLTQKSELLSYERGDLVTQKRFEEGKKWYFAIHHADYVRGTLLAGFERVEQVRAGANAGMTQDVWLGFKPHG